MRQRLTAWLHEVVSEVFRETLPGVFELADATPAVVAWLGKQRERIEQALRDEDQLLFEQAMGAWVKGWERVNEMVAEKYRAENPDPGAWEIRYLKWMRFRYIHCTSPHGDFFIVPRPPAKPPGPIWYTPEDLLAMLDGAAGVVATVEAFGVLPIRAEAYPPPMTGEQDLHIDFTGEKTTIRASRGGRRGR